MNDFVEKRGENFDQLTKKSRIKVRQGDSVIVAIGYLGHGYDWVRQECEVLEVAQNSVKIRWPNDCKSLGNEYWEYWIDPNLILDNLTELRWSQEEKIEPNFIGWIEEEEKDESILP